MEDNQNPTSPIAGEPAVLKHSEPAPATRVRLWGLRATLHRALADYADVEDGWAAAAGDLSHAVYNALQQVDALLGITEPEDGDEA